MIGPIYLLNKTNILSLVCRAMLRFLAGILSGFSYLNTALYIVLSSAKIDPKLKPVWRDNNISLGSKVKLMPSHDIFHDSVCLCIMDFECRIRVKNAGF